MKDLTWIALLACLALAGCTTQSESPDQLRKDTADATARLKTNTKAIVEGVREGLKSGEVVDVNSAPKDKLLALPGINDVDADRIIANRPYSTPHDLVSRRIVSQGQYDQIKDHVEARK